jgi:hypothetical protein
MKKSFTNAQMVSALRKYRIRHILGDDQVGNYSAIGTVTAIPL